MKKLTQVTIVALMIMTLTMGSVFTIGTNGEMGGVAFEALTAVASTDTTLPTAPVLESPELPTSPTLSSVSLEAPELIAPELPSAPTLIAPELPSVPTFSGTHTSTLPPVAPQCPFAPKAGRTIIHFGQQRIYSDGGSNSKYPPRTNAVSTNLPAGSYDVSLFGWDGYINREKISQPNERYYLAFIAGGNAVVKSNSSGDLADMVRSASFNGKVNSGLVVPQTITAVRAEHAVYPDTSSPNSLNPICAALDVIPEAKPVPTCSSLGYAYQVGKFEWDGSTYKLESSHPQFNINLTGSAATAAWTSNAPIGAVIAKAATNAHVFQGGMSGSITKYEIGSGKHDISNAVFCANKTEQPPAPVCEMTVDTSVVPAGGGPVTFTWTTSNASAVSFNQNIGSVPLSGSKTINVTSSATYVLTATNQSGTHVQCSKPITVAKSPDPIPDLCPFESKAGRTIIDFSGTRIRSDQTAANSVTPVKPVNLPAGTYTVTLAGWDGYIGRENVSQPNETWKLALKNGATTIATSNSSSDIADFVREAAAVTQVNDALTVTQAITAVQGIHSVYPDKTSANSLNPICAALDLHEVEKPQPVCTLVANNTTLPVGGGNVTLTWTTQNADTVTLTPDGSTVAKNGSKTVFASSSTSFVITVTNSEGTKQCPVSVTVPNTPDPLTCSDVTFTGNPSQVSRGGTATLAWNWNNRVTSASIDNGIGAVSNNGSRAVTVDSNTTYNLTIKNATSERVCPVTITTTGGGGGGGSRTPRCELDISKSKIRVGESVKLTWDTTNATEVVIKDDTGKTLVTTEDKLSREKRDLYDGEITLRPTKDTTYTLNASRGSRDRDCKVEVEIEGSSVTVTETRTQPPLVAGISLTQVPYTGFEAGPMLTIIFYVLLAAWSFFVTYLFVIRRDTLAGVTLPGTIGNRPFTDVSVDAPAPTNTSPAAAYVASETATAAPVNLPTGTPTVAPVIGYAAYVAHATEEEAEMGALENRAHAQKALLSSDAMRYLMHTEPTLEERAHKLDAVIRVAKVTFPTEDGWVVLNLPRMEALLGDMQTTEAEAVTVDTTPTTGGSLAEAIVTGNVIAAFGMIQHRPMIALADAAADLDALYRARQGETVTVSDLLVREAAELSDAQITAMIAALTTAIDGTYQNEAEAVKMAIMKAISAMV
jgi:hypothetical protein